MLYKRSYFPEPYTGNKNKIIAELDFENYGTKSYLKNSTGVYTSECAKKTDSDSLKSDAV